MVASVKNAVDDLIDIAKKAEQFGSIGRHIDKAAPAKAPQVATSKKPSAATKLANRQLDYETLNESYGL